MSAVRLPIPRLHRTQLMTRCTTPLSGSCIIVAVASVERCTWIGPDCLESINQTDLAMLRVYVPQYIHIGSHDLASLVRDVGDHSMRNVAQWVETNAVLLGTVTLACLRPGRYV